MMGGDKAGRTGCWAAARLGERRCADATGSNLAELGGEHGSARTGPSTLLDRAHGGVVAGRTESGRRRGWGLGEWRLGVWEQSHVF